MLEKRANVEKNMLSHIEIGKYLPSLEMTPSIARALGVNRYDIEDDPEVFTGVLEMKIIGDRFLEEIKEEVPKEYTAWLSAFKGVKDEVGYPARIGNVYGFIYDREYWHTGQTDAICKEWVEGNPSKSEKKVLNDLKKAGILVRELEQDVRVFVGEKTAPLDAHELVIFFPEGTSNVRYKEVMKTLGYALEYTQREEQMTKNQFVEVNVLIQEKDTGVLFHERKEMQIPPEEYSFLPGYTLERFDIVCGQETLYTSFFKDQNGKVKRIDNTSTLHHNFPHAPFEELEELKQQVDAFCISVHRRTIQATRATSTYEAAFHQVPLEEGIKKEEVADLLGLLGDKPVSFLRTAENNSTAYGFIETETLEEAFKGDDRIVERFVGSIIGDQRLENPYHCYVLADAVIYVSPSICNEKELATAFEETAAAGKSIIKMENMS